MGKKWKEDKMEKRKAKRKIKYDKTMEIFFLLKSSLSFFLFTCEHLVHEHA
jgi:hypothetical protein